MVILRSRKEVNNGFIAGGRLTTISPQIASLIVSLTEEGLEISGVLRSLRLTLMETSDGTAGIPLPSSRDVS